MDLFSILNSQFSTTEQVFLVAVFGLIFGSLASLLSYRLVSKEAVFLARSQCVNCHTKLRIRNLIPLFSWLYQRGKCSYCQTRISVRYPLIESVFAISFVLIYFLCGKKIDTEMLLFCLVTFTLITMSITDLEHYFIPNSLQYLLAILVILLRINDAGAYGALTHLKAAFAYLGFGLALLLFFYITTKTEAIGIDDIKLFFIAGLLLGMDSFLLFMLVNGILGTIFGAIWQKLKNDGTFPFAPPIAVAFYIAMLFGSKINLAETLGSLIF